MQWKNLFNLEKVLEQEIDLKTKTHEEKKAPRKSIVNVCVTWLSHDHNQEAQVQTNACVCVCVCWTKP